MFNLISTRAGMFGRGIYQPSRASTNLHARRDVRDGINVVKHDKPNLHARRDVRERRNEMLRERLRKMGGTE